MMLRRHKKELDKIKDVEKVEAKKVNKKKDKKKKHGDK